MKTIKILLLSFLAITLMSASCSADEVEGDTGCQCKEVEEVSSSESNFEVWILTGDEYPTEYNCTSDGYFYTRYTYYSVTNPNILVEVRNRVVCQ